MKKRILAAILAAVMIAGVLPFSAFAAKPARCNHTEYTVGETIKTATCQKKGMARAQCNKCKETITVDLPTVECEYITGRDNVSRCKWCRTEEKTVCEHENTHTVTVEESCKEDGSITEICDACGETISTTVLPKNDEHIFVEGINEGRCLVCDAEEPTCTHEKTHTVTVEESCKEDGSITEICDACGETISTTVLLKNNEHIFVNDINDGKCLVCNADKASVCDHKYEIVKEEAGTCVLPGYVWEKCSLCGNEKNHETKIDPKAHKYEVVKEEAGTCVLPGYVWEKCALCGNEKNHETEIDPKAHKYEVVKEEAGTCVLPGYVWEKCTLCGNEKNHETDIDSNNHKYENGVCECGAIDPETEIVEVCTHPDEKLTKDYQAATCTEGGHSIVTCQCGVIVHEEKWGALEHMKLEKIEPATCTSEGKIHVVCRRCSELLLEEILPVRDHVKLDKSYPATCTEDGREHVVCTACNTVLLDKVIPAGHEFEEDRCVNCGFVCQHPNGVEEEVAATCTSEGSHSFVCPDCKLEKKEVYPILGHAEKEKKQEPTCTQPGLYHVVCTRCNKLLVEKELPVLAHKNENGKCTVCGTPDVNYVPPKPSVPEDPSEPEDTEDSEVEENNNNWLTWDLLGFHIVGNAGK